MARPYLIVSHDYTRTSAGVRALHNLARELSAYHGGAFVTGMPGPRTQHLQADEGTRRELIRDGIVVYPEVEDGNPLGASRIVRYFLNVPGRIRRARFTKDEVRFAYCGLLSKYVNYDPKRILTVPVVERDLFNRGSGLYLGERRNESAAFWTGQKCADAPLHFIPETNDAIEITYDWPPRRLLLAGVLKKCKLFYSYANYTALLTEARLCGCPSVVIPNALWTREKYEAGIPYGMNGLAWGQAPEEIHRARQTVERFGNDYDVGVAEFGDQISNFVRITQEAFK